jgi:methylmalonyl-CoA epimerase
MIKKLDHIGIAVEDLEESAAKWAEIFQLTVVKKEELPDRGVRAAFLPLKQGPNIELIASLGRDSVVDRYIRQRGEGIHHICFEVENIREAMNKLKKSGVSFTADTPVMGAGSSLTAFIHPKNANGVLIELKEKK